MWADGKGTVKCPCCKKRVRCYSYKCKRPTEWNGRVSYGDCHECGFDVLVWYDKHGVIRMTETDRESYIPF